MKNKMFILTIGIILGFSLNACATILYNAIDVKYSSDEIETSNVQDAIDYIYNENKSNIINTLNDKGIAIENNSTYGDINKSINDLPIRFNTNENNEIDGYFKDDKKYKFGELELVDAKISTNLPRNTTSLKSKQLKKGVYYVISAYYVVRGSVSNTVFTLYTGDWITASNGTVTKIDEGLSRVELYEDGYITYTVEVGTGSGHYMGLLLNIYK